MSTYDLIIVGGGPAGCITALYAHQFGLKCLLLEKESFPRDKICGDAISGKSMGILEDLGLLAKAAELPGAVVRNVVFGSPQHKMVSVALAGKEDSNMPPGLVVRREIFDAYLFAQVRAAGIDAFENAAVSDLKLKGDQVCGVKLKNIVPGLPGNIDGKIVIGADGYKSVVARKTGLYHHDPKHWIVALRQYYKNVGGLTDQIELHYIDEVLPGYFWIFPVDDQRANVGIGMLHSSMKKQNVDLKLALRKAIESPAFRERFIDSEPLESPVGWNLPIASKRRPAAGNGFMLVGDAAGLIDPFTGEGIGNAMYSGREAARIALKAIKQNDFRAEILKQYEDQLWQKLGSELHVSSTLQKIGRLRFLLSFVINKAARDDGVKTIISGMMANTIPKKHLANPLFYLKLLLR